MIYTEFIPAKYRKPLRFSRLSEGETEHELPHRLHRRKRPLVIGPSRDPVLRVMHELRSDDLHVLVWETFGERWTYRVRAGRLQILSSEGVHDVQSFYMRSFESVGDEQHLADLHVLMHLLSALEQKRIGTVDLGISNTSKVLHLHRAVRRAAEGLETISVPETWMVKSLTLSSAQLSHRMGPSVAKSLSSTRTQVFDDRVFRHFHRHRPAHVPVLIQSKKVGMEVRVHCVAGELFPLGILNRRDGVDYRYSKDIELVHDVKLSADEAEFCRRIQRFERNPLIGVDLIRDGETTYCFEANPNPGWASFEYDEATKRRLAHAIVRWLET